MSHFFTRAPVLAGVVLVAGAGLAFLAMFRPATSSSWLPVYERFEAYDSFYGYQGVLVRDGHCLYLDDPGVRQLPIWPREVRWNDNRNELTLDGITYNVGDRLVLTGQEAPTRAEWILRDINPACDWDGETVLYFGEEQRSAERRRATSAARTAIFFGATPAPPGTRIP